MSGYLNLFPWGKLLNAFGTNSFAVLALSGASDGILVGLVQALVFRHFFRARKWFVWALLTAAGVAAGSLIMSLINLYTWYMYPLVGLLVGAAQIPLLEHWFKLRHWWLWPISYAVAWLPKDAVWRALAEDETYFQLGG